MRYKIKVNADVTFEHYIETDKGPGMAADMVRSVYGRSKIINRINSISVRKAYQKKERSSE
jgi:hypothetical protein